MRDITRSEAIELLKSLRFEDDETCSENLAVDMAIASLETDEAYDLMYEQPEFCKDCISREALIKRISDAEENFKADHMETIGSDDEDPFVDGVLSGVWNIREMVQQAPSVLPKADVPDINVGKIGLTTKNDCISRKAVQTRLKEIINEMETIFADIREREVNDSVCGLCEYDCDHGLDGFANECPGFEKDDCFKLKEKYRAEWLDISNLPSVTPQKPRKITLEDVKGYCEPRSLTIISNELLYELTHPKIKALEQESASTQEYGLTDADTDKYAVQVQNGEGYYNSFGRYVSYDLD